MKKLTVSDLWKLEEYAEQRQAFRQKVLAHKKDRTVALGPNMTLLFEDRLLIQYQVQEMLRIERIFEKVAIQEELDAYNPLIPDGSNWKATCLIEFPDIEERQKRLVQLKGIEDQIWVQVGDHPRVMAIADEDMDRSNETKTSAVHFLRFELTPGMIGALRSGAVVQIGADHPAYRHTAALKGATLKSLLDDLIAA
jgi:hypothetical protein